MMHDNDASREQANDAARRPQPSVDDFVTWSEIEQKIHQVAQPQASQRTSSGNWRWGWVVVPLVLGLFRFAGSGTRREDPQPYIPRASQFEPGQLQFDQKQRDQMLQEAQKPQGNPPRQQEVPLDELQRMRKLQEPMGPPKP
jgi:hypothetical protein